MRAVTKRAAEMRELLLPEKLSQAIILIALKNHVGEGKSSTDVSALLYESTVSFPRKN